MVHQLLYQYFHAKFPSGCRCHMFSCAWHRFIFSQAWYCLHNFSCIKLVTCFPALGISYRFPWLSTQWFHWFIMSYALIVIQVRYQLQSMFLTFVRIITPSRISQKIAQTKLNSLFTNCFLDLVYFHSLFCCEDTVEKKYTIRHQIVACYSN